MRARGPRVGCTVARGECKGINLPATPPATVFHPVQWVQPLSGYLVAASVLKHGPCRLYTDGLRISSCGGGQEMQGLVTFTTAVFRALCPCSVWHGSCCPVGEGSRFILTAWRRGSGCPAAPQ